MAELLRFGALDVEGLGRPGSEGTGRVKLNGVDYQVTELQREGSSLSFVHDGQRYRFDVVVGPRRVEVADARANYSAERHVPGERDNDPPPGELVSKMPGKVLQLLVAPGTAVTVGTPLLILEAMKMEHQVTAPADGVLNGYPVSEGERVMPGVELADFTASAD